MSAAGPVGLCEVGQEASIHFLGHLAHHCLLTLPENQNHSMPEFKLNAGNQLLYNITLPPIEGPRLIAVTQQPAHDG